MGIIYEDGDALHILRGEMGKVILEVWGGADAGGVSEMVWVACVLTSGEGGSSSGPAGTRWMDDRSRRASGLVARRGDGLFPGHMSPGNTGDLH
ncbi:hypothetical protein Tco_0007131 [Tanacetum coccineum]